MLQDTFAHKNLLGSLFVKDDIFVGFSLSKMCQELQFTAYIFHSAKLGQNTKNKRPI